MDKPNVQATAQRVRNILTLEERVRAIEAYDINPVYTKVSKLFNCSWEQIKNIVANRETIMKFYDATKRTECNIDANKCEIRQNKISFLGECMYEYIQRAQYHTKVDVTEELIRIKAFEFLEIIQIENFIPNRTWMNHFKATYGFCLSNRQIKITRRPPTSLDVKDIMTYCTKNNVKNDTPTAQVPVNTGRNLYRTATKIAVSSANDATLQEVQQRQEQKKNLLERAFFEFMERHKYQHKLFMPESELLMAANELKEILQVDQFEPTRKWYKDFMTRAEMFKNKKNLSLRTSTSLDLSDIISHCVQQDKYNPPSDINESQTLNSQELPTCSKKRPATAMASVTPDKKIRVLTAEALKDTLALEQIHLEKCRPIIKEEIIDTDENEIEDIKPNVDELNQCQEILNEENNNNNKNSNSFQEPLLKIQKTETDETDVESERSTTVCEDRIEEEPVSVLPKTVNNYKDALKCLKPLQEFALLKNDYSVIGLLSQLEDMYKKLKKKT